jgi:ubiquitin carboxyl-terminal hydrolase 22/27/51
MRPYTEVGPSSSHLPDSIFQYDLSAVVTHEGKLDNGHYWADVLSSGEWWHCDDDKGESWSTGQVERSLYVQ